jgi:hypothetical protein
VGVGQLQSAPPLRSSSLEKVRVGPGRCPLHACGWSTKLEPCPLSHLARDALQHFGDKALVRLAEAAREAAGRDDAADDNVNITGEWTVLRAGQGSKEDARGLRRRLR